MPSAKQIIGLMLSVILLGSPIALAQDQSLAYARVAPADLKWGSLPSMPKGAQIAVLHGSPAKSGLFTIYVKLPANFKLPVHSHPDERIRTIISGTYYSAIGDKVDSSKLMAFPPGTFSHVPPKVWQFAETRDEEVVFQITGIGPTGIDYLNVADDPRKPPVERASFPLRKCAETCRGGERKFLEPLMRFTRGDVRVHLVSPKIDHRPPGWR